MLTISVKHPDSESFIDAKLADGKVTGANISVRISDEFMKAVTENTDFIQSYPIDIKFSDDSNVNLEDMTLNKIYKGKVGFHKKINARKLWDKIIYNNWKSAEPGVLFWDNIINESIPDCYADLGFKTVATNPCVSEDTLILTDIGYVKIGDIVGKSVNVWNGKNFTEVTIEITGYNQKMMRVTFSDGNELKCTPYHGFYTWEGFGRDGKSVKKECKNLVVGDKLEKFDYPMLFSNVDTKFDRDFYTLGFFAGDGFVNKNSSAYISLYGRKKNLLDKLNVIGDVSENLENDRLTVRVKLPESDLNLHDMKKYIPKYHNNHSSSMLSWLAGIIDSDGSRNSEEGSISISSIDKQFLIDIKLHLLNIMGIRGTVIDEKEGGLKEIKGHEYETNKSYRLLISAYNVKKLYDLGLRTYRVKIDDVKPNRDAGRFITVKSIEAIEDAEKVYCFTEKERGRGCFNGIVTANCGEITLSKYDSCRLLCLNLFGYVVNPFTPEAFFNWDLFKSDVIKGQRYMDDIIDLEIEKIDGILRKIESDPEDDIIKLYEKNLWMNIKKSAINGRRTGLGVTGEGDMLAALGLTYGSDEGNDFAEKVHKTLKLEAYRSSVILAKERGTFPIYDSDRELMNPFILRIQKEDPILYNDMYVYGRRNIALLTCAPTGSVSILTQTTSGIEPVFMPVYKRRRKINPQEKDTRVDFVDDEGISWQEYPVFHHNFETWLTRNDYDIKVVKSMKFEQVYEIVKKSPYYKATSSDVNWVKKVEMQGRIQKHIDHSISATTNVPKETTEELIGEIYKTAFISGCKGMTVYRDGCRSGVLISDSDKKEKEKIELFREVNAPKRPKRLRGEIIRFQNNLEKWIAVVGLLDGRPYEIFTGKLENGLSNLPQNIKECEIIKNIVEVEITDEYGKLIKVKRKRYDIEYVDGDGNKQYHTGLNHAFNPEYWNYAKLISGNLRHGMPLVYVYDLVDSLNLKDDILNTWKNGVARVIKRYIKDGEKTKGKCPECGHEHFVFEENCLRCVNCKWSKCS